MLVSRRLSMLTLGAAILLVGCATSTVRTPTTAGLNTNNLVDIPAQIESLRAYNPADINEAAQKLLRANRSATPTSPKRTILCLSGGGSYGAYSAGILCGWTKRGDRPDFEVVTGVSTGGLTAPFAFLGPAYDGQLQRLYTTLQNKDIYILHPVRGVFSESLADNSPLARQVDRLLTPQMMRDLAIEHSKGRRLFLGTTESQGRRFVVWDIGEIACRGRPEDRELIKRVILGSSSIPGFFPPSHIPVTVDGQPFVEKHVDGSVSFSLFIRPPYSPEGKSSLHGCDVYAIVAGKLYADPEVVRPWVLSIAAENVETLSYAQVRADLNRLWTVSVMTGMNFHLASIPFTTPAPKSSTEFIPAQMKRLFDAGVCEIVSGNAWRNNPPGTGPGEDPLVRASTQLDYIPRSPDVPVGKKR